MTANYDQWLESPYRDRDDEPESWEYDDAIEDLANDYMRVNFSNVDTVVMSDVIYSLSQEDTDLIDDYIKSRDFEKLGRKIWAVYMEQCEYIAKEYATKYIKENGLED